MELPRRRTGSYEPRSDVGNVLAPVSGTQGSAELRTTPSTRGQAAPVASRPPWATELDAGDAAPSPPPPKSQHAPAGRSPSTSRQQASSHAERDPHGFSFHTPTPAAAAGRPPSGGRAAPADQLDLWSRQQQQQQPGSNQPSQVRRGEGLYARVEHVDSAAAPAAAAGAAGRRATGPRVSGSGEAPPRLPPGDLSAGDRGSLAAPRSGAGTARGGAAGPAAARVNASPARTGPSAEPRGAVRSTSTPKPRPTAPPKRSTSITDNVHRDWVDVGVQDRRAGGAAARGGGSTGAGRWDADPDGADRGSWLFTGDAPSEQSQNPDPHARNRDTDPESRPTSDRRRQPDRAASVARSGEGEYGDGGGEDEDAGGGRTVPDKRQEIWHPPPPRRPRPQSPAAAGALEATLSPMGPAAAAPAASLAGEMSLGHGPSAGLGDGGHVGVSAAGGSGRSGSRPAAAPSHSESARHVQVLQEDNTRLRDQVQHLERLLAAVAPGSAASASSAAAEAGRGRRGPSPGLAGRPSSAGCTDAPSGFAAAAAGGVVLQQYKSQIIQLQRQVALMSQEIEAKARLSFEAEGALLELATKLGELATSSSSGSNAGTAAPSDAATAASAAAGSGGEGLSRERLLQLQKWSKQMLGRLKSEKSGTSKLFTREAAESAAGHHRWSDRGGIGGDTASYAPSWAVPFLPAGGNRFLMPGGGGGAGGDALADDLAGAAGGGASGGGGGGATVAAIAAGKAALLADPLLAHRLEMQLAGLAPKLASLAVLLKTQLLPSMPWLGLEAADRLQAEVGEAAEGVAQSVEGLVQLCSLLPAGAAVFGDGPVAQEPKRRAAEVDAGRDSWLYSSPELVDAPEPPSPAVTDDGVISVPRLQAAIAPLLRDRKTGSKALADILEPVRSRSMSLAAKRAVLETELRFAARASALQAEHVSHLMLSVGMALEECRGAKDAAAIKSYFNAAAAVRQVLEAADALELHPCETCLKSLVDVIRVHRDTLGRLPELLVNAPAADVEGRLLAKVEELHQGFKKAISRLEGHKRRHLDAMAGGAAASAADRDSDYEDDFDDGQHEEHGASSGGGGAEAAGRVARGGGSERAAAALRRPPSAQSPPQGAAAKAAKPPKPRPEPRREWQD